MRIIRGTHCDSEHYEVIADIQVKLNLSNKNQGLEHLEINCQQTRRLRIKNKLKVAIERRFEA